MAIMYKSTRNDETLLTSSQAILQGLSPDGGLFVPTEIPVIDKSFEELSKYDYRELAFYILRMYFSDFSDEELKKCIENAYDSKFDDGSIAPLVKVKDRYFLELFHGATLAFKDMALSILPHLITTAARKNNISNDIVILTATSGDTGKAALSGFANVPGTKIVVFYPEGGVSNIQRLQMVTQKGDNTCVIGVKGNFDDCQTNVKKMFNNPELNKCLSDSGYQFSSANSINIGRLIPQVVYYVWSYCQLINNGDVTPGEKINFVVPTGNFGNILAGYFAKLMGLPVNRFICASNENNVLYDFFRTGTYDKNRKFKVTISPSMDILVSSNLERLVYMACGNDARVNRELMESLSTCGRYTLPESAIEGLKDFYGSFSTDMECLDEIKRVYDESEYVIDTHTSVASCAYGKYVADTGDHTPAVILSTASPFKFLRPVVKAIDPEHADMMSDYDLIYRIDMFRGKKGIPTAIQEILALPIKHKTISEISDMEENVKKFLGIEKK